MIFDLTAKTAKIAKKKQENLCALRVLSGSARK